MSNADPILAARVEALDQNLQRVKDALELVERVAPGDKLMTAALRDKVKFQVTQAVERSNVELAKLQALITNGTSAEQLSDAWSRYQQLQESSQELFAGCLELIGGCAYRQNLSDEDEAQVWAIADRLIVDAALDLTGSKGEAPWLTVPALQEALSMSRVRTVRIRFPEWTLWSLPLIAYDFGHVAITEFRITGDSVETPLLEVLDEQTAGELEQDEQHQAELAAAPTAEAAERHTRRASKWARHRLRVLLADALATHWMGPAYVCAAVRLRFDPSSAFTGRPNYDERVRFVIRRLRALANGIEQNDVVDQLESEWQHAVERADPPRPAGLVAPVSDEDLMAAFDVAINVLPGTFRFGKLRWQKAIFTKTYWEEQGTALKKLEVPDERLALREVLNAAWLTRLAQSPLADELASVAVATGAALEDSG